MELRDELTTMRQDGTRWEQGQRALADTLARWRSGPAVASVLEAMEPFGCGEPLDTCPPLAALFSSGDSRAREFADGLVATGLCGLRANPLGQLPLSHGSRDAAPALILARSGRATLALAAYDGAALASLPSPRTAHFRPVETWIHVLAGSGSAQHILRRDGETLLDDMGPRAVLQSGPRALEPGVVLFRYGTREALQVRSVDGAMTLLRLERLLHDHEPEREYSLPDGVLLHQSCARNEDSRDELAMALLGRMGRTDALPGMARIAIGEGSDALRWEAVREAVTLHPNTGIELLARIASTPDDPLALPAAALQARLIETWPELEGAAPWPG